MNNILINKFFAKLGYSPSHAVSDVGVPTLDVEAMGNYVGGVTDTAWGGDKFLGGFGLTKDYSIIDHWLLRKRSKQLFTENLYARGLIRRLITNELNKGLSLEATPDFEILNLPREFLSELSENIERRFSIWGSNPSICDYRGIRTFGAIQRQARMMALVSGDVLVVLRQGKTKIPNVDLYDADHVSNPISDTLIRAVHNRGNEIKEGVEVDKVGRHIAFFVEQENGIHRRITARGSKTNRLQAWLYYGTERLIDDIRGQSLLALVIQSLKEIDRYRDAEQRSAVINSMIAMWVEKTEDKPSSLALSGGAVRKDSVTTQNDANGRKDVEFSAHLPGLVLQELQQGEKPTSYDTRRPNVNFAIFEAAIINGVAWANEVPPEVLTLAFQNNYSASRGAVNEFKMYLEKSRSIFGEEFNGLIYQDYLISDILSGNIDASGFLEAWRDPFQWDKYGAWVSSSWSGAIKPNVDLLKEVKAYKELVDEGWLTRDRASRELTGMKYSKVTQQLVSENEQLVLAKKPLIDAGLIKNENPLVSDSDDGDQ